MIRPIESTDRSIVRSLQNHLTYADPGIVDAAIDGPFLGRIAIDRDRRVGYAVALPGPTTTISELVVAPALRRQGHGRALVESIATAVDADRIVVTTPISAKGARRFYADLGFEPTRRRSGFYSDGTDALCLVRRE